MAPDPPGSRRVAATTAVAVLACVAIGAPAALAAAPSVTGSVTGKLPSAARALTEIRAIELGGAQVAASGHVSAKGAFRLDLPAGAYVLDMSITPRRGRAGAVVSRAVPVSIAPGQRRHGLKIAKPTARSAAVDARYARAAYTQESGAIDPGRIAFVVDEFAGATGELGVLNHGLTELLETDLSSNPPCRNVQVAGARDRALVLQELTLQKSKYFDPSGRVKRNFVSPDILIRGRLHNRGANLGYTITLVDARTRVALETLSGTLPGATFFDAYLRLAAQVAKRICAYGEVFEVTYTGTGTANFPTHSAAGTLSAQAITAKPTARDAEGPTRWEGSSPMSWTNVTATSKIDCSFRDFLSGGTWTAKLERVGETMRVMWIADAASSGTATTVCPDGGGRETSIPGQPTTSLVDAGPDPFILPSNATQAISGKLDGQGFGWDDALELKVRTTMVQRLG
jgi:hypothetical protein